jgi:hypothetical protein
MFDDVVKEPVPNELLDLLKLIDEQGEGGDTSS